MQMSLNRNLPSSLMAKDSRTKAHFKTLLLVKTLKDNFEFEVSLINILVSSLEESKSDSNSV